MIGTAAPTYRKLSRALALMGFRRAFPRCANCGNRVPPNKLAVVCESTTLCGPCWYGGAPIGALRGLPVIRPLSPADN